MKVMGWMSGSKEKKKVQTIYKNISYTDICWIKYPFVIIILAQEYPKVLKNNHNRSRRTGKIYRLEY